MTCTERRLLTGAAAVMKLDRRPTSPEAIYALLSDLRNGVVALQSLDDLGDEAANEAAWQDMLRILQRTTELEAQLLECIGPVRTASETSERKDGEKQ